MTVLSAFIGHVPVAQLLLVFLALLRVGKGVCTICEIAGNNGQLQRNRIEKEKKSRRERRAREQGKRERAQEEREQAEGERER